MKRLTVLLALLLLLTACSSAPEPPAEPAPESSPPAVEAPAEEPAPEPEEPAEAIPLTAQEIEQVNAAFEPFKDNDVNPLGIYLMAQYASPQELNLAQFLAYFPSEEVVTDPAEFEALKEQEVWPFGQQATLEQMPVPIHRIPAEAAEAALKAGFGIVLDDLNDHPYISTGDLIYLAEYDCYYNFTSDANFGLFVCTEGTLAGDTLTLTGDSSTLVMKRSTEDPEQFLFYSFTSNQ